jgi:hypothetical protein
MGRGRAKAKQQRVARELKYSSQNTDLDALQRELSTSPADSRDDGEYEDDEDDWVRASH